MSRRRNTGYKPGGLALLVLFCAQLVALVVWAIRMAWHHAVTKPAIRRRVMREYEADRALHLATQRVPLYVVPNHYQQPLYTYPPVQRHPAPQPSPRPVPFVAVQHHTPQWSTYDNPWA